VIVMEVSFLVRRIIVLGKMSDAFPSLQILLGSYISEDCIHAHNITNTVSIIAKSSLRSFG